MVALADVPPFRGRVHVGDGLGFGDGVVDGDGVGDGEADGAGLDEVVGVADRLPPLGPAPHATSKTESAMHAMTRMREGSHQHSPSHRACSHAVDVTLDLVSVRRRQQRVVSLRGAGAEGALSPEMRTAGPRPDA
jgi:hypothetical protein